MIPFLVGKVRVTISKSVAKKIFECADRTFGGVAAVGVWGEQVGRQRCICGSIFSLWGSTLCGGCGEWGMHHAGVGVCGMSYSLYSYPRLAGFLEGGRGWIWCCSYSRQRCIDYRVKRGPGIVLFCQSIIWRSRMLWERCSCLGWMSSKMIDGIEWNKYYFALD